MTLDDLFSQAVSAIDAGDTVTLRQLFADYPRLASNRLDDPGPWLRDTVGNALDGFFSKPYLLWFVAEDPARRGKLPENIVEITEVIIDGVRTHAADTLQSQLNDTLRLVAWSGVAAACGVQIPLIDTLVRAGAVPGGNANNALVNGHIAAAERLVQLGAPMMLSSALCLGKWEDVPRLAAESHAGERQFALVLAALNGKSAAVKWLVDYGVPVSEPSADLYSHATPLHHAVCSGSLDTVMALVNGGANVNAVDTAWNGTPLGWAFHYVEEAKPERRALFVEITEYLRWL